MYDVRQETHNPSPLVRKTGAEVIGGDAVHLTLNNFPGLFQASDNLVNTYFPLGQPLLIREPWMKKTAGTLASSIIRVDSPTDVVLLSRNESVARDVVWCTPIPRPPYLAEFGHKLESHWERLF